MNIIQFAFVDPAMIGATLVLKYAKHFVPLTDGAQSMIALRDVDGNEISDTPLLQEWVAARQFLVEIQNAVHAHLGAGNLDIGQVGIEALAPGAGLAWSRSSGSYVDSHLRFVVGLTACAGAWTYCEGEAALLGAGNLAYLNQKGLRSEVNFGAVPRIRMFVDFRKPTQQ